MFPYEKIKEAEEKLKSSLSGLKNKDKIFEAIVDLLNLKVQSAIDDLRDRMDRRGIYDPDY